jgi:AcrR family transcriptional regulator
VAEGKRTYTSAVRTEQARRTRAAVIDAAERCFLEGGYTATTMKEIATAAGVSPQTVFAQGSKASLLLLCVDRSVTGDDEAVPLLRRAEFERLLGDGSRAEKLAAFRQITLDTGPRLAPIARVFAEAAAADPEIAAHHREYGERRRQDSRAMVGAFERWLRPDLDLDQATDIFWAVFSEQTGLAFFERGWSAERFADWFVDAFQRLLLRPR